MERMLHDRRGSVATYVALFAGLGIGAGALAVDIGRLGVLRAQMQNHVDAAAMAAARQLDARAGSRARARAAAQQAISAQALVTNGDGALVVDRIDFYAQMEPERIEGDDFTTVFAEVTLRPQTVDLLLEPVLAKAAQTTAARQSTMQARAVARPQPFVCHAPPLMICDLGEIDLALDPMAPANAGRQIRLKEQGGGAWAPGNFGLLALPDGSIGANDIERALAAVSPADCY
ncbi:MAG TPA: pilus assembly protein TadG-related protein, partial [Alphaproteobacteria bacterium]|nr:pilus assembly protein TadG-related protein [Alphaproteobacteria bacterium]